MPAVTQSSSAMPSALTCGAHGFGLPGCWQTPLGVVVTPDCGACCVLPIVYTRTLAGSAMSVGVTPLPGPSVVISDTGFKYGSLPLSVCMIFGHVPFVRQRFRMPSTAWVKGLARTSYVNGNTILALKCRW